MGVFFGRRYKLVDLTWLVLSVGIELYRMRESVRGCVANSGLYRSSLTPVRISDDELDLGLIASELFQLLTAVSVRTIIDENSFEWQRS